MKGVSPIGCPSIEATPWLEFAQQPFRSFLKAPLPCAKNWQLAYRGEFAKPIVDTFFAWLARTLREQVLLPSNPFTQAAPYALEREAALRVFLE